MMPEDSQCNGVHTTPPKAPSSPGCDLPKELVNAGWRKFYSKREQRPYYFNKFTNQSLWDQPTLGSPGSNQWLQDPLGIATPSPSAVMSPPPVVADLNVGFSDTPAMKRRHSTSETTTSASKKPLLATSTYWNFEIPTNVIIYERAMSDMYPPHPDIEAFRAQLVVRLRQQYEEACMSREGIVAPRDSFNRWLMERKVYDRSEGTDCDGLLSSDCEDPLSTCMIKDLLDELPMKLLKPKCISDARRQLSVYAEHAKEIIETKNVSPESRKIVKWNVDDTFSWLQKDRKACSNDFIERLAHLKRQCQPHLVEAARSSVEAICRKLHTLAKDDAQKLCEMSAQIWREHGITEVVSSAPPTQRKVYCYPRLLGTPSPRLPVPQIATLNDVTSLTYKDDVMRISTPFFYKLEQLYKLSCKDDPRYDNFLSRVWCVLRRYQTFFGVHKGEGSSMQCSLPIPVYECLNRVFGVTFECFASPLNCYYRQYCSAFPDTDGYFGSRGSILDFHALSGSFQANPPYCEELTEAMAKHFEGLLELSSEPLSFIIFLPEWRNPPTKALIRLEASRFKRDQMVIPANEHEYRHGFQHMCAKNEVYIKSSHNTLVIFLQNDGGFERWGPTAERLKELTMAFHPPPRVVSTSGIQR